VGPVDKDHPLRDKPSVDYARHVRNDKRSMGPQGPYYQGMQTIAKGKDAVLEYLEDHALAATNEQPGEYILFRDDAGSLVLSFAGHTFFGSGTMSLGGKLLDVTEGRVHKVMKPS
jgi:hypothetical protein